MWRWWRLRWWRRLWRRSKYLSLSSSNLRVITFIFREAELRFSKPYAPPKTDFQVPLVYLIGILSHKRLWNAAAGLTWVTCLRKSLK
jgi:hypothetical protein